MSARLPLLLAFKGDRDYVLAADILNALFNALPEQVRADVRAVDFAVHRMVGTQLVLEWSPGRQSGPPAPGCVAVANFSCAGADWSARVFETGEPIALRQPYDEAALIAQCKFTAAGDVIILTSPSSLSPVETAVSLTKALHLRRFASSPGKWVCCRIASVRWPVRQHARSMQVRLDRALGTRLTRSVVVVDDEVVGQIYFSLKAMP